MAGFALGLMVWNAALLGGILPAGFSAEPPAFLASSCLLTNVVHPGFRDLGPLLATAAVSVWRQRVWGQLVTSAMLVMLVLES